MLKSKMIKWFIVGCISQFWNVFVTFASQDSHFSLIATVPLCVCEREGEGGRDQGGREGGREREGEAGRERVCISVHV